MHFHGKETLPHLHIGIVLVFAPLHNDHVFTHVGSNKCLDGYSLKKYAEYLRVCHFKAIGRKTMTTEDSGWIRMRFKQNKVWVAADSSGKIQVNDGKALIKYQREQDYEYRVRETDLFSLDSQPGDASAEIRRKPEKNRKPIRPSSDPLNSDDPDCIQIFADGASSGNPGPSGIGVLLRYRGHEKEISRNIGLGTNNIAELEAIRTGLLEVKNPDLQVKVYTDSGYAYGLLMLGWKAKKNMELVSDIRMLMKRFKNLTIIKVKGHSGIEGNERADKLATSAILQKA
jgi:ribonuclease HI